VLRAPSNCALPTKRILGTPFPYFQQDFTDFCGFFQLQGEMRNFREDEPGRAADLRRTIAKPQNQLVNARKENQIAWMLVLGIAILLLGILVTIFAFGSAMGLKSKTPPLFVALGPIMVLGGIVLAGWGVFYGHFFNRKVDQGGVRFLRGCYVVGRFAYNENKDMIFSDFEELDSPKAKFYVRIKTADGQDEEFECARALIEQVGEGMIGDAQAKGRWLGSFVPKPRA
jgi:hypothetical protein